MVGSSSSRARYIPRLRRDLHYNLEVFHANGRPVSFGEIPVVVRLIFSLRKVFQYLLVVFFWFFLLSLSSFRRFTTNVEQKLNIRK